MSNYNDFEKLCKRLDNNRRAKGDMNYVKLYLVNDIIKNKDDLLKLKAECQGGDFITYATYCLSLGAMIISIYSILIDYASNHGTDYVKLVSNSHGLRRIAAYIGSANFMTSILVFLIFIFAAGLMVIIRKYAYINYWRKYILVYLDDIEKNWTEYFTKIENSKTCLECKIKDI